jgi:pimeloyl-ACP methyl ester carboxylesterase
MGNDRQVWPRFRDAASRDRYLEAYDAALAAWPVPYESIEIPTPVGPSHAVVSGPAGAPLVVLLPSFAGTALAWRANAVALSQHWRVCALDVIGQPGRSAAHGPIGEAGYARWLDAVLDHLGAEAAALVGCSFGGFVAASYARLRPGRVERLVLIGPVGVFAAMPLILALRMMGRGFVRRLGRRLGDRRAPTALALHAAAAPKHPEDEPWRRLMATTMAEAARSSPMRPRVFSRAELAQITAPTLLLIGEYEMLYDPQTVAARARAMKPGLTAEVVAGADHIAAMAQPEAVNARIAGFLLGAQRGSSLDAPAAAG